MFQNQRTTGYYYYYYCYKYFWKSKLFENPQRTGIFHDITGQEPTALVGSLMFVKCLENCHHGLELVFFFWEPWSWTLITALITGGGLVQQLQFAFICGYSCGESYLWLMSSTKLVRKSSSWKIIIIIYCKLSKLLKIENYGATITNTQNKMYFACLFENCWTSFL